MAKRKKKHHKPHRRKVSGISPKTIDATMLTAGAMVGAATGWLAYTKINGVNNNLMGFGQIGLGLLAAIFVDEPLIKGIGLGIAGTGAIITGENVGFLSGISAIRNLPNTGNLRIAGYGDVRQLGNVPGRRFPSPGNVGKIARRFAGGGM